MQQRIYTIGIGRDNQRAFLLLILKAFGKALPVYGGWEPYVPELRKIYPLVKLPEYS